MNGSRANPRSPKDAFQDYDIVYLVKDPNSLVRDKDSWIDVFGERMIMQIPEADSSVVYLMQFTDGNRIDLTLAPVSETHARCTGDNLTIVLNEPSRFLVNELQAIWWAMPVATILRC